MKKTGNVTDANKSGPVTQSSRKFFCLSTEAPPKSGQNPQD